jgi:hypothetical protein
MLARAAGAGDWPQTASINDSTPDRAITFGSPAVGVDGLIRGATGIGRYRDPLQDFVAGHIDDVEFIGPQMVDPSQSVIRAQHHL